ncbi:MAG: diguanylate cyclase [Acidobacteria bacterium]|nr:diguanylate cyclase [Acidobacteriota bacterium]MCB9397664.1 diguanylate cyclase [Acidobacteriota bacterium]
MKSVLIVDDEPQNLLALVQVMESSHPNVAVFQALDGRKALAIARARQPELIITDWEMPEMDGLTFIRQLKMDAETAQIPVIMCTGVMTTSENLQTALEAGAVDYIRKPVDPIELTARVGTVLKLADSLKTIRQQNLVLEDQKLALEVANARLLEQSVTDALTGLPNRRKWDEIQAREQILANRYHTPLGLIMIDIDHFKRINDTFGHDTGDQVLKRLAELGRSCVRDSDLFARWGGEEFAILLRHCGVEESRALAEKLRHVIETDRQEPWGSITASFGVTAYHWEESATDFLKRADGHLYRAKHGGRNQVVAE